MELLFYFGWFVVGLLGWFGPLLVPIFTYILVIGTVAWLFHRRTDDRALSTVSAVVVTVVIVLVARFIVNNDLRQASRACFAPSPVYLLSPASYSVVLIDDDALSKTLKIPDTMEEVRRIDIRMLGYLPEGSSIEWHEAWGITSWSRNDKEPKSVRYKSEKVDVSKAIVAIRASVTPRKVGLLHNIYLVRYSVESIGGDTTYAYANERVVEWALPDFLLRVLALDAADRMKSCGYVSTALKEFRPHPRGILDQTEKRIIEELDAYARVDALLVSGKKSFQSK